MTQANNTFVDQSSEGPRWRFWIPRFLAIAVGLILLVAGLVKALDMELFIRQIRDYGIITERFALVVSAWGLVVLECGMGVGLLVLYRPSVLLPSTALLFLIFAGVTIWAWLTEATQECGCYGDWLQQTPGHAAIENLVLLAASVFAWMGCRHTPIPQTRTRAWAVTIACLIGLGLPLAFDFPTLGVRQPSLQSDETSIGPLEATGLNDIDLNHGVYLIVLMGTDCLHCQEAIPALNMLSEAPDLPPLIALCTSKEADCIEFTEAFLPVFPIGHISEDLFWQLLSDGTMPRTILLEDGRIKQVWDKTVPDEDAIRAEQPLSEPYGSLGEAGGFLKIHPVK
jgi:hypothetical protein